MLNSVAVVDDFDRQLPCGEEGEIVVRGENIFLEYWEMPEATAYTFRNNWHHTGGDKKSGTNEEWGPAAVIDVMRKALMWSCQYN